MTIPIVEQIDDAFCQDRLDYLLKLDYIHKQDPLTQEITDIAGKVLSSTDAFELLEEGKSFCVTQQDIRKFQDIASKFRLFQTHPELRDALDQKYVDIVLHKNDIQDKLEDYNKKKQGIEKVSPGVWNRQAKNITTVKSHLAFRVAQCVIFGVISYMASDYILYSIQSFNKWNNDSHRMPTWEHLHNIQFLCITGYNATSGFDKETYVQQTVQMIDEVAIPYIKVLGESTLGYIYDSLSFRNISIVAIPSIYYLYRKFR